MEQTDPQDALTSRRGERLRSLHEIVFALNIVSAVALALLLYTFKNLPMGILWSEAGYYFLRAAIRIDDSLHLDLINAVTTGAVGRQTQGRWGNVGVDLLILISVVGASLIVLLVLRLFAATSAYGVALHRLSLPSALFAAPMCYLLALKLTGGYQAIFDQQSPSFPFWQNPLLAILVAEIICAIVLFFFFIHRARLISTRTMSILVSLHYAFWVVVLWSAIPPWVYRSSQPYLLLTFSTIFTPFLLLMVVPLSGIIWLLSFKRRQLISDEATLGKRPGKWTWVAALVYVAVLAFVWLPGRAYSLTHPNDPKSVTVELSRGPCYGRCPSYSVVIHGNGVVEYLGRHHVRVHDPQASKIDNAKLMQILEELDNIRFFAIEDRAFAWCFDTPSVGVSVLVDGKSKRVVSDSGCTGPRVQAQFVRVAQEIDSIVGSDSWVKCEGHCRD